MTKNDEMPLPNLRTMLLIAIGNEWYNKHTEHVNKLVQNVTISVPPSGVDVLSPELWKPMHWRWFFDVLAQDENIKTEKKV